MKYMTYALITLVLVAISGVLYLKYRMHNTPDGRNLEAELDTEIGKMMKGGLSYGLVIGVYKDGKTFIKGYGSVSKETDVAPTASTVFEIASITKLFTASTLQVLSDKGILQLDSMLGDLMGDVTLSPSVKKVTLRQLATHRSGFPAFPDEYLKKFPDTDNISRDFTTKEKYAYLGNPNGKQEPGSFEYSNFGAGLLGRVLATSAKKNYEDIVTVTLLEPLGMTSTFVTVKDGNAKNIAQGYSMSGNPAKLLDWSGGTLDGAGSLKSTAHDMVLFIKANVDKGDSPLSRSLHETHEPQFGGETAIGWMLPGFIDRFMGNQSILWHSGLTPGCASYIAIDTKYNTGLIILSNKATPVDVPGTTLMRLIRTQSWASS
ncbi:MAG: beta-lactamase family protein [Nitrososphaera sp.]|nr:beta-lactamase family protein [Nitrososphaera sp.]